MQFFQTVLAFAAAVAALPAAEVPEVPEVREVAEGEDVSGRCGQSLCTAPVAMGEISCPVGCFWGPCTRYHCSGSDYDMACGRNQESCVVI